MQKIERYGVIALVFLLVTILAVSLWGESKGSWFGWGGKDKKELAAAPKVTPLPPSQPAPLSVNPNGLPLSDKPASSGLESIALPLGGQPLGGAPIANPASKPIAAPAATLPAGQGTTLIGSDARGGVAKPIDATFPILRGDEPAAESAGPVPAPLPAAGRKYVVKSGDTLGAIASRELGSATRWEEISKLNGNLVPEKLAVGMTLTLPAGARPAGVAGAAPKSDKPKASAAGSYVVKSGDSLSRIAARELGDGNRWNEIVALNPGLDAQHLKVGARLVLPGGTPAKRDSAPESERVAYGPDVRRTKSRVQ